MEGRFGGGPRTGAAASLRRAQQASAAAAAAAAALGRRSLSSQFAAGSSAWPPPPPSPFSFRSPSSMSTTAPRARGCASARSLFLAFLLLAWSAGMVVIGVSVGRQLGGGSAGGSAALLAGLGASAAAGVSGPAGQAPAFVPVRARSPASLLPPPFKVPASADDGSAAGAAAGVGAASGGGRNFSVAAIAAAVAAAQLEPDGENVRRRFWPRTHFPAPTTEELLGTAIVTMATGDESGRHAVALLQSLRDAGTRVPTVLVLLVRGGGGSADCRDPLQRRARGRDGIVCEGLDTTEEEIVSRVYLDALVRLGARFEVFDPLPETPYTAAIPGGRQIAWGMALNKLHVFGLTQFRRVLWIDSDTLVFNNIDHLMLSPEFTAAFTNDCGNRNADAKMSGGLWVFTPSAAYTERIAAMLSRPVPGTASDAWLFGDMQVVLHLFGKLTDKSPGREWPFSRDMRQGTVPGLRALPAYASMSDSQIATELLQGGRRGNELTEPGVQPAALAEAQAAGEPVWNMLDPRYDGLVGNCENVPERDLADNYFSVHFTCLPVVPPVHKPGRYENEEEFLQHVRSRMKGCMRYYFLRWYDCFARGVQGRLPEPFYEGPEVRLDDPDADAEVEANRKDAYDVAVADERRRNEAAERENTARAKA